MKIFYKKDFQRVKGELEKKEEELAYKEKTIITLHETIEKREKEIAELKTIKSSFEKTIDTLSNEKIELGAKLTMITDDREEIIKKLITEQNSNRGYIWENKKLKKQKENLEEQVKELTKQVEDLKSDRYLVKKIPSGRTPTQKINHIPGMRSNVRKFMNEKFDYGGTNGI